MRRPRHPTTKAHNLTHENSTSLTNLANAMRDLAADPERRNALGRHGRELAEHMGTDAYLRQLTELMGD